MTNTDDPSLLAITADADRARTVEDALGEAGYARVVTMPAPNPANLLARIQAVAPDVIIIDLPDPDRATLDALFAMARVVRRPIALFVGRADAATIAAAVEVGVGAFVVDGFRKERIGFIVEMAITRFHALETLRRERDTAVTALAERKIIDRAKGILMRERAMTEEQAYTVLRKTAMKHGRRIAEIAESVVTTAQLEL